MKIIYASRNFPKKFKLKNCAKKYIELYRNLFIINYKGLFFED